MKRWIRNLRFVTPVLLVLGGTFLLSNGTNLGSPISSQPQKVAALTSPAPIAVKPAPVKVEIQGVPVRIIIPSLGIDLPVDKGYYNAAKKTWTLSGSRANYAVITPPANNTGGNTFIYGHNNRLVFSKLPNIKTADVVILKTDNGHTFYYTYRDATDVQPNDVDLFKYQGKPILTVQTCSGAWYQNRRLFVFDLLRVE